MIRLVVLLVFLISIDLPGMAQGIRNYRQNEVINAGGNLKIEILKCRGTAENEECDVIYYTEKRQQGRRVWEKTSKIRELELSAKNAANNNKPLIQEKQPIKNVPVTKDNKPAVQPTVKEIPKVQPDVKVSQKPNNQILEKEPRININPAHIYSLQQCFVLALENNINLKKAQNNIAINVIDNKTAKFSLLPSMSYSLGHYFSFGKNIDPVTNDYVTETFSGGYTAVGLQLQLFSGFSKLNTIKQTAYMVSAAEYAKKRAELELLTNVTLTYARLLLNKDILHLQRNDMLSTTRQLEVINEKIKVGRLTRYESYAFTARLNTEQANVVTTQNDSSAASQYLKQLLNIPFKQQIDIASIDTIMLSSVYAAKISTNGFIDTILLNHPLVKQAKMDVQVAEAGLKVAKSNLYPSLSVGGNVSSNYNVDQTNSIGQKIPLDKQINDNMGTNVNISLRVPIFNKRENTNRIKKEKINISNAQLNRQEAENTIVSNTMQLINDFNASRQKYIATLSAMEHTNLSYNMYEEKYKLGQISSLELLAARDLFNAASSKYIQAKLELFFRYQLLLLLKK